MAMNGGKIEFGVSFRADNTGLNEVKQSLQEIKNLTGEQVLKLNPNLHSLTDAEKSLKLVKEDIGNIEQVFKNAFDSTTGVTNINKLNKGFKQLDLQAIAGRFNAIGVQGQKAFSEIAKKALTSNIQFRETTNLLDRMAATFGNTVRWGISSKIINTFTGSIQQAWGYVKHLDTSLNDIRIVTDKSADEMDRFAVSANKAAKELGAATTDYTEAALIYYQQGLGDEEAQARAETTLKAANVTGQTGREVSEELTAVWNGYKVTAEETELYVDKLAAVAASTASDLEELSTGMSKVASAANNMGVDVDQLNAQLATIISVTRQAPETAGTALKTIFARIEDLKLGGEDEDGIKLGEVSGGLESLGIEIKDSQGDLRDLGEVIEEVGTRWDSWTESQQSAIAQLIAGKRQYNNLLALFDNWGMYNNALETSRNSIGTLQQQQDIYMESTEAHLQQLETTWEGFYQTLFDTDSINDLTDGLTSVIEKLTDFTKLIGGGKGVLLGLGTVALNVFGKQLTNTISDLVMRTKNAINNTKALKAEIELTEKYAKKFSRQQGHELSSEALDEIILLKQHTQSYYDVMSKEEIAAMNRLVQDTANVAILKETWEENTNAAQEYVKKLAEIQLQDKNNRIFSNKEEGFNYSKIQALNGPGTGSEETDDIAKRSLEASSKSADNFLKSFDKAQTAVLEYYKALYSGKKTEEETIKGFNMMEGALAELSQSYETFIKENVLDEETQKQLQEEYIETKKRIELLGAAYIDYFETQGLDNDAIETMQMELQAAFEKQEQGVKKTTKAVKDLNKEQEKVFSGEAREKLDHYNDQLELNERTITSFTSEYNTRVVVQFFTDALKGATNLAFGLQQLTNLSHVWEDENSSFGSKILSTITALGMALPTLKSGYTALSKTLSDFNKVLRYNALIQEGNIGLEERMIIAKKLKEGATFKEALAAAGLNVELIKNAGAATADAAAQEADAVSTSKLAAVKGVLVHILAKVTAAFKMLWGVIKTNLFATIAIGAFAAVKALQTWSTASAKAAAETAKLNEEATKTKFDEASEAKQNVDSLISSYRELREEYDNHNITIDELRSNVYDLANKYDVQLDSVKLLTAGYEELDDMMNQVQVDAGKASNAANAAYIKAQKERLKTESASYVKENTGTIRGIANYISGAPSISDFIDSLGIEQGAEAYDAIDSNGELDWDKFYELNEEQQGVIEQYYQDRSGTDDAAKATLQKIKENTATMKQLDEQEKQYQKDVAATTLNDLTGGKEITDLVDYNDIKKQATERLAQELQISSEDAAEIVSEQMSSQENMLTIDATVKVGTDLAEEWGEPVDDVVNQISKLPKSTQAWIAKNKDLIKQYGSIKKALEDNEAIIDSNTKKTAIGGVKNAFSNMQDKQFREKDIDELYNTTDFEKDSGISRETFDAQDFETQQRLLLDYYVGAAQASEEYKTKIIGDYEEIEKKYKENNVVMTELLNQYTAEELKAATDTTGFLNTQLSYIKESGKFSQEAISEALIGYSEGTIDASNDVIKYFLEEQGLTEDQIKRLGELSKVQQDYTNKTKDFNKEGKGYSELSQEIGDGLTNTRKAIEDAKEGLGEWHVAIEAGEKALASTSKSIDDLQSAYNSLNSIVETYNMNGTLTMDNLQTILAMDDQYLAALQFENGQMSLNTEVLKQLALAKLDDAEATIWNTTYAKLMNLEEQKTADTEKGTGDAVYATTENIEDQTEALKEGKVAWYNYWKSVTNKKVLDDNDRQVLDAAATQVEALHKVREELLKGDFGTVMETSSSSKSSSSDSKEEELEREEDIYHNINNELDDIETKLSRIQKFDEHSWGASAQEALKEENKLLDAQIAKYKEKAELQAGDLASQRASLQAQGLSFSDSGYITNSEDKLNSLYAEYNAMVAKYNSMTESGKKIYKTTLEAKKESIEDIEKAIEKYESTYSEYQETLDTLLDKHYEDIENAVNQFNASIDIHLELSEAEREWNDFWKEVVEDVEDTDYTKNIEISLKNLSSLIGLGGDASASDVGELTKHLNDTTSEVWKQINSADTGGSESMFGDDTALSEETLTNYKEKLMNALRSAKEEVDNIAENYLGLFDKTKEMLDKQIDGWETIGDHLDHNVQMAKLLFGEKAYKEIGNQYEFIYENNLNKLQDQKLAVDTYLEQMNTAKAKMEGLDESSKEYKTYAEAYEKASENYKNAVSNLDKSLEDSIKKLQEQRQNELNQVMDNLDKALSGGMGLDNMEKEWKLVLDMQNYYLDNIERSIEMQSLKGEFSDVIESYSTQASVQKELLKFQDEEIAKLEKKNQLTQYDIDEVKARLEIKKAELALEEAQRNKSNMRLRRDSQGNYTYQYTANEDAIDDAENGLLTAKKDWWELVKKRNQENSEKIMDINKQIYETEIEYQNALDAHDQATADAALARLKLLEQQQEEVMGESATNKQHIMDGTQKYFADVVSEGDGSILKTWNTTVQEIQDKWYKDGEGNKDTVTGAIKTGIEEINTIEEKFKKKTEETLNAAGVSYDTFRGQKLDPTTVSLQNMQTAHEDLELAINDVNEDIEQSSRDLDDACKAYEDLEATAVKAIEAAQEAWKTLSETIIKAQAEMDKANQQNSTYTTTPASPNNTDTSTSNSNPSPTQEKKKYKVYGNQNGSGLYYLEGSKGTHILDYKSLSEIIAWLKQHGYHKDEGEWVVDPKFQPGTFKSGGYTGDWNQGMSGTDNGRLAVLHQKELVLNEADTSNLLKAVSLIRTLVGVANSADFNRIANSVVGAGSTSAQLASNISSGALQSIASNVTNNSNVSNTKDVTINADFSGVRSADEIYKALTELQNYNLQNLYA